MYCFDLINLKYEFNKFLDLSLMFKKFSYFINNFNTGIEAVYIGVNFSNRFSFNIFACYCTSI